MSSYLDSCKFTLDWLQGVLPFSDVRQLFKALGEIDNRLKLENWAVMGSLRNYRTRFICNGMPAVSIAYNDDFMSDTYNDSLWFTNPDSSTVSLLAEDHPYNPGIFVSISGDGLRWLNVVPGTVEKLLKYLHLQAFKCSRLDVACDIFEPNNDLVPTVLKAFKNAVSMRPGRLALRSNMRRTSGKNGTVKLYPYIDTIRSEEPKTIWNCSFGDHGSSFGMFRCYDKWFEIASGRLSNYSNEMLSTLPHQYWYRLEYELHRCAPEIFNLLAEEKFNVKSAFGWCADNMFDIVKVKNAFESVDRRIIPAIWQCFVNETIHFV